MSIRETWPWDVGIDTTKAALQRCMAALILTDATMTCSMRIGNYPLGRGVSATLRVHIPEGRQDEFRELAKPYRMAPPPQVSVGMNQPKPDGHPGRTGEATP